MQAADEGGSAKAKDPLLLNAAAGENEEALCEKVMTVGGSAAPGDFEFILYADGDGKVSKVDAAGAVVAVSRRTGSDADVLPP